jgi:hypothetical protein
MRVHIPLRATAHMRVSLKRVICYPGLSHLEPVKHWNQSVTLHSEINPEDCHIGSSIRKPVFLVWCGIWPTVLLVYFGGREGTSVCR